MKKLIFSVAFAVASVAAVMAQDTTGTQNDRQDEYRTEDDRNTEMGKDDDWDLTEKDMISITQLPESARETLQGQDYNGWTVLNAYRKIKDHETMYAVELGNGNQKKKLKFDADGNLIKEKTKRDKDQ